MTMRLPRFIASVLALGALAAAPLATAQTSINARQVYSGSAKLSDIMAVDARVYGWKADGVTNNGPAINAAIAACSATAGCRIDLPSGPAVIQGTVAVNKGVWFRGNGNQGTAGGLPIGGQGTSIICTSLAVDCIQVLTQQPVKFENMEITAPSQHTAGALIAYEGDHSGQFAYAREPEIIGVKFRNGYDEVDFRYANSWRIVDSIFQDSARYNVNVSNSLGYSVNPGSADYGDWEFTGNRCQEVDQALGTSQACLHFTMGGSGVISGNKILGGQRGVDLALAGGPTGTMLITANSFEQQTKWNIDLNQTTSGIDYANVVIDSNQFANQTFNATSPLNALGNIHVGTGTPASYDLRWIRGVSVGHNVFNNGFNSSQGAQAFILVEDGSGVDIGDNIAYANASVVPGAVNGVNFISVQNRAINAAVHDNIQFDNPALIYGPMTSSTAARDAVGATQRAYGDAEQTTEANGQYTRTHKAVQGLTGFSGWTTMRSVCLTPSPSGLTAFGTIDATVQGHTNGRGFGARWTKWEFTLTSGSLAAAVVGSDTIADTAPPGFRVVTSGSCFLVQAQSSDGASALTSGTADVTIRLPDVFGTTGAPWTVN